MRLLPLLSAFALVGSLAACSVVGSDAARTTPEPPAPPAPPARLAGTTWLAEDVDGKGVIDRAQSTIEFIDDKRVAGSLGCNRYTGSYSADATGMRFSQLASTRRMCPEALMQQEARFNAALGATRGFRVDHGGAMTLLDAEGRTRARLMPLSQPK
jgi:heat shock protein HslJ